MKTNDYQEQERHYSSSGLIVAAAERILEERYADQIRISDVAAAIGVSRSSLCKHFAALRGQAPSDYLQSVRLRHALGLLVGSSFALERIAETCGFYSASHLSRRVKEATGVSPGRLRKRPDAFLETETGAGPIGGLPDEASAQPLMLDRRSGHGIGRAASIPQPASGAPTYVGDGMLG